jgi:hypothetical protein
MGGLFNSTVLEVVIGLVFVYLLLAIICTAANEWIAGLLKARSKVLSRTLKNLLGSQPLEEGGADDGLVRMFYEHPLIKSMMRDEGTHFAYLPARTFSKVLLDLASPGDGVTSPDGGGGVTPAAVLDAIRGLPEGDVKRTLLTLLKGLDNPDVADMQRAVEAWFEDTMDRATGWYKRRTQVWTVIVAAVITLLSNADTFQIGRRLWTDPVVRGAVVEEAKVRAQKPRPSITVEYPDEDDPTNPVVRDLGARSEGDVLSDNERVLLGKLLGWQQSDIKNWTWWPGLPQRLVGWALTILAVSLGAPFWFDVLNKFMHVRSAGKSPDEVAKRPEKKKQPPEDKTA